ncbi:MAG TPA: alpha/beta hydrolase [Fibrobacteria bacterium]|nr:alpha/beta hydrolase [Fibrobacteria bacterium]
MSAAFSRPVLILPGYGGSGPAHWQTLWQHAHPEFIRVEERDWDRPDRNEWVKALEGAVGKSGPGTLLVAHSLACLQVAHWAANTSLRVHAALLVAPPDPEGPEFPALATGFSPLPMKPLPFPAIVVGSTDDPYATPAFTEACAKAWGARFVSVGAKGHINASSGLGRWDEGWELLKRLE